jgi:hypothetical protein
MILKPNLLMLGMLVPSVIPALGRLRQENGQFEDSLGYIVRFCLKTK